MKQPKDHPDNSSEEPGEKPDSEFSGIARQQEDILLKKPIPEFIL